MKVINFVNGREYPDPEQNAARHAIINNFKNDGKTVYVTTLAMAKSNGFRLKNPKDLGYHQHGIQFPLPNNRSFYVFNIEQFNLSDSQKVEFLSKFQPKKSVKKTVKKPEIKPVLPALPALPAPMPDDVKQPEPELSPDELKIKELKQLADLINKNIKHIHTDKSKYFDLNHAFKDAEVANGIYPHIKLNFDIWHLKDNFGLIDEIEQETVAEHQKLIDLGYIANEYLGSETQIANASIALDAVTEMFRQLHNYTSEEMPAQKLESMKKVELISLISKMQKAIDNALTEPEGLDIDY